MKYSWGGMEDNKIGNTPKKILANKLNTLRKQ